MSQQTIELLSSQTVAAGGPGAWKKIPTLTMADVVLDITAKTGAGALDIWLEGSHDGQTKAYEITADHVLKSSGVGAAETVSTDQRDIVDGKTTTTAERFFALYKHLPTPWVRLNWSLASGDVTMSASLSGK